MLNDVHNFLLYVYCYEIHVQNKDFTVKGKNPDILNFLSELMYNIKENVQP